MKEAIETIGAEEAFMGPAVGLAGSKPEVYKQYEVLIDLATPEQLRALISDDRPAVRIYAFQGMMETNHPETFNAFKQLISDKTSITTFSGCFLSSDRINELAAHIIANDYTKIDHYKIEGQDRISFDSLILNSDDLTLRSWSSAIGTVAPADQHYPIIKRLAVDSNYITAWSGLANFNREGDLALLHEKFSFNDNIYSSTLDIIFRYPHPSFLSDLKTAQRLLLRREKSVDLLPELYLAIFQYTPEQIAPFLKAIDNFEDQQKANQHRKGLWIAAQLHHSPNKRNLAKDITKELRDEVMLTWWKDLAKYSSLD